MLGGNVPGKNPLMIEDIFPKKSIGVDSSYQLSYYLSSDGCLLS